MKRQVRDERSFFGRHLNVIAVAWAVVGIIFLIIAGIPVVVFAAAVLSVYYLWHSLDDL